jgi:hypothetical protein
MTDNILGSWFFRIPHKVELGWVVGVVHGQLAQARAGWVVGVMHDQLAQARAGWVVGVMHDQLAQARAGWVVGVVHGQLAQARAGWVVGVVHDQLAQARDGWVVGGNGTISFSIKTLGKSTKFASFWPWLWVLTLTSNQEHPSALESVDLLHLFWIQTIFHLPCLLAYSPFISCPSLYRYSAEIFALSFHMSFASFTGWYRQERR